MSRVYESDKRRYLRYEVLDYAVIRPAEGAGSWRAVIVDIGLGGIQVRSRSVLPLGVRCRIEVGRLDLPPLVLRGEVRHSSPVPDSDLFATGIRFVPEDHEERMCIAEFVHGVFQRQCDLLAI